MIDTVFAHMRVRHARLQTEALDPVKREVGLFFWEGAERTGGTEGTAKLARLVEHVVEIETGRPDPVLARQVREEMTARALQGESLPPR